MNTDDPAADLSPEARVLLLCARGTFGQPDRGRVLGLIESGVDWSRMVGLAQRHGLATILYRRLNDIDPAAVPKPVFARLWGWHEAAARRNEELSAELRALLLRLEEQGIPALPFKGPVLAVLLYDDVSLREFGDLDILVRSQDMPRARELVETMGYAPEYPLRPRRERKPFEDPMHYAFAHRHREKGFLVELHWSTDCRLFAIPEIGASWWERRPVAEFQGVPVRALTPEELLYLMCMHATRHHWSSLGWISDLAEMIRRHPGLDSRQVLDTAGRQGTLRILLLGFELAQRLLEAPIPEEVRRRIAADAAVSAMAGGVIRRLGVTTGPAPSLAGKLSYELAWLRFWPPWLAYVLKDTLLPNMADWSRWDLPPLLSFLYYPLHFVRLASKYWASPAR